MLSSRLATLKALLFLACLALGSLAACGGNTLEAATPSVTRKGIVRVTVEDISKDVLQFKVHNLSKEPLTVIKSEIEVVTPGGQQPVHIKLTLKDMERHDPVEVHFDNAIRQRGQPVAMDPVLFYVKHASE